MNEVSSNNFGISFLSKEVEAKTCDFEFEELNNGDLIEIVKKPVPFIEQMEQHIFSYALRKPVKLDKYYREHENIKIVGGKPFFEIGNFVDETVQRLGFVESVKKGLLDELSCKSSTKKVYYQKIADSKLDYQQSLARSQTTTWKSLKHYFGYNI